MILPNLEKTLFEGDFKSNMTEINTFGIVKPKFIFDKSSNTFTKTINLSDFVKKQFDDEDKVQENSIIQTNKFDQNNKLQYVQFSQNITINNNTFFI